MKSIATLSAFLLLTGAVHISDAHAIDAHDAGVDAMLKEFTAAFNKGDMKAVKALHVASPTIQDEVPPHMWSGTNAFDQWGADLAKSEAAEGKTGGQVALGKPTREVISGDHAYVIAPSSYTFEQNGHKMREKAQLTFILAKEAGAWKIASWTWTGPEAKPLK